MDPASEQLARRDRLMRHFSAQMTPEQRIARGRELNDWAMKQLLSNPEGYDRWLHRNMRQRAISHPLLDENS